MNEISVIGLDVPNFPPPWWAWKVVKLLEQQLKAWPSGNEMSQRLATIPGIGLLTATALAATVGEGKVMPLDASLAINAAHHGIEYKLALADSIIYATAQKLNALVWKSWTQDSDFEWLEDVKYFPRNKHTSHTPLDSRKGRKIPGVSAVRAIPHLPCPASPPGGSMVVRRVCWGHRLRACGTG